MDELGRNEPGQPGVHKSDVVLLFLPYNGDAVFVFGAFFSRGYYAIEAVV